MRLSADHRGQLGLDQRLIDRGRCRPDPLINLRSLQHFKQLKQGRLIQSHRVMCPFARTIGVVSLTITRWPSPTWSPTPTRPTTYTTSWDITLSLNRLARIWLSYRSTSVLPTREW